MRLTEREVDRILIWSVGEMARRRRERGLRLNYPEAVGLICDEVMERARGGASMQECEAHGMSLLDCDDVLEGVPELVDVIEVEVNFDDGTKLLSLRRPIQ